MGNWVFGPKTFVCLGGGKGVYFLVKQNEGNLKTPPPFYVPVGKQSSFDLNP